MTKLLAVTHTIRVNRPNGAFVTAPKGALFGLHSAPCTIPDSPPSDFIRIGSRVIEHIARIRIHLPTSCPERTLYGSLLGREPYFNDGNRAVSPLK